MKEFRSEVTGCRLDLEEAAVDNSWQSRDEVLSVA